MFLDKMHVWSNSYTERDRYVEGTILLSNSSAVLN
jgi:hypothetical protein